MPPRTAMAGAEDARTLLKRAEALLEAAAAGNKENERATRCAANEVEEALDLSLIHI